MLAGRVLYVAAVGDRADWTGQFAQQLCHDWWMEPEVVTGLFALGGVILGSGATHLFGLVAARQKTQAEDDRRWLADRRTIYAAFLGLCESLLWESQKVVWALPRMWDEDVAAGEDPDPESYNDSLTNLIYEFHNRVDTELLTALGELQLMAGPQVADSAIRSAVMNFGATIGAAVPTGLSLLRALRPPPTRHFCVSRYVDQIEPEWRGVRPGRAGRARVQGGGGPG